MEDFLPYSNHFLDPTFHVLKTTNNIENLSHYVNAFIVGFTVDLIPQCPIDKLSQLADITKTAVQQHGLDYHYRSFVGRLKDVCYLLEEIEDVAIERNADIRS